MITQINCLTSVGRGSEILGEKVFEENLQSLEPERWITKDTSMEVSGFRCSDESYSDLLKGASLRRLDRFARMNVAVLKELELENLDNCGYIMGTSYGTWDSTNKYTVNLINEGAQFASPRLFPNTVLNAAQGQVCIYYQIKGEVSTVTGVNSLAYACDLIERGMSQRVIAVGSEEICENLMEMYQQNNSQVKHGEACAVVILESLDYAKAHHSNILCEVKGYRTQSDYTLCDGFEACDPSGAVLKYALDKLCEGKNDLNTENANVCVLTGSNGSPSLEEAEISFLEYFKANYYKCFNTFNAKGIIGETFGASGMINAVLGALAIHKYDYTVAYALDYQLGGNETIIRMEKYVG